MNNFSITAKYAAVGVFQAHVHLYIIQSFVEKMKLASDVAVLAVLTQLFKLYATYGISTNAGDFIEVRSSCPFLDDVGLKRKVCKLV